MKTTQAATLALILCLAATPSPAPATEGWPEFRGPTRQGEVTAGQLPLQWGENLNVKWKVAIHGEGWSTPVVHGGQVWLTTATSDGKRMSVLCVDRDTGRVLHDAVLFEPSAVEPLGNPVNRYASPSPAIEQGRVFVHFGSYGTACLDTQSFKTLWSRADLPCRHYRGPGSSPLLHGDRLILTMDGVDHQYLVALNKATGETLWRTDRATDFGDLQPDGKPRAEGDFRKAYTTPIVVNTPRGEQLISPGAKSCYAYDPQTGKELWRLRYNGFSNAASPVVADGVALINTGYGKPDLLAVRIDDRGDLTSKVLWVNARNIPKRSSPVVVDGMVFLVDDNGVAHAINLVDGKTLWTQRLGGQFSASPLAATVGKEKRVYFFGENGVTTVIRPGPKFEPLATNTLDAGFMASPAVAGQALFLRTTKHLYRIEP